MSKFVYPEWRLPPGYSDPPSPPDPETLDEINTRIDESVNRYGAARQKALYTDPDAYFRRQGRAAVDGVPWITGLLDDLKTQISAGAGSDHEQQAVEQRLSALIDLDKEDIDRHARQQNKEWRRHVMGDRIELMRQRAGLEWNDRASLRAYLNTAEDFARSQAATDGLAVDSEEGQRRLRTVRTDVLRAAIEGALDGSDTDTAAELFDRAKDHIHPEDADALSRQIAEARQLNTARAYVHRFVQRLPNRAQEIDEAHRAALQGHLLDYPDDPDQRAVTESLLNAAFASHRHGVEQRRAELEQQIEGWLDQRLPDGRPQDQRPPRALWMQLDPDQRQKVYDRLRINTGAPDLSQLQQAPGDTDVAVPARGVAANVEPPPGSPEFETARASIPDQTVGTQTAMSASAAVAAAPATGETGIVPALLQAARAVAPYVGAAVTPVAAAVPLILIPTNTQSGTVELDDGLRARIRPGQRSVTLERKSDGGLLGSGIGAKWEDLPIEAEIVLEPGRGRAIRINPDQLRETLGEEQAQRVLAVAGATPPSEPQAIPPPIVHEMRIAVSVDGGKTWEHREASQEEVQKYCANYPKYQEIALEAAQRAQAAGIPNGPAYGRFVHKEAEAKIRAIADQLKGEGVREIQPEIALRLGIPGEYLVRGMSKIDVVEIHDRKVLCVYDFKTGDARFPAATKERYGNETRAFTEWLAKNDKERLLERATREGYTHIYVIPVQVP